VFAEQRAAAVLLFLSLSRRERSGGCEKFAEILFMLFAFFYQHRHRTYRWNKFLCPAQNQKAAASQFAEQFTNQNPYRQHLIKSLIFS